MSPHSLPAHAEPYRDELASIEAELDEVWPGYERLPFRMRLPNGHDTTLPGYKLKGRPFTEGGLPRAPYSMDHVRRLKWLLKRHMLLMQGLDYGVVVSEGTKKHEGKCFAHPTGPRRPGIPHPQPPHRMPSPGFGPMAHAIAGRVLSPEDVAVQTGKSLDMVRQALAKCPAGHPDPVAFVRDYRPWMH